MTTFAQDFEKLMQWWNEIESKARKQFPNATEDELFRICSEVMERGLGIK